MVATLQDSSLREGVMSKLPYHEMNLPRLMNQLTHVLVQWDKAEERSEMKRGRVNIYRMGILLKAKEEAEAEAKRLKAAGESDRDAFVGAVTQHFTATRRMHTFLKKVDPTVDVQRGRWVVSGEIAY
jgi:hypothetical protein